MSDQLAAVINARSLRRPYGCLDSVNRVPEAIRSKCKAIAHLFKLTKRVASVDLEVHELEHDIMGTASHGYPTNSLARRHARMKQRLRKAERDWRKAVDHLRRHPLALRMLLSLAINASRSSHTCYTCHRPMAVTMNGMITGWPNGVPGITLTGLPQYGCEACQVYVGPDMFWNFVLEAVFGHYPNGSCYDLREETLVNSSVK